MDAVNKAYAQIVDVFKSLTPGGRIAASLLVVVVAVSLVYLFQQQAAGPDSYLMGGELFSTAQLRDMQAAFGKAGLEAQVDGARVKVPHGQESKYMAALAESGALPAEFGDYLKRAANNNSFLAFRPQQEALLKVARQSELQNIINHLPGVEKSAVQIDEQVERGLNPKKIITASVNVVPKGNQPLDEQRVRAIRCTVASAVAGLKPEAVTVVDLGTARPFPGTSGGDAAAGTSVGDYADYKKRLELDWQEKISGALHYIPGVVVRTNVELDREITNEETSIENDPKRTIHAGRQTALLQTTERGMPASLPGFDTDAVAQQPARLNPGSDDKNASDRSTAEQRSPAPTMQRHIVREGRTPKRVTVSVAVPHTYYEGIWRKQNATAAGESRTIPDPAELAMIQAAEPQVDRSLGARLAAGRQRDVSADCRNELSSGHGPQTGRPADARRRLGMVGAARWHFEPGRDCTGRLVIVALRGPIGQRGACRAGRLAGTRSPVRAGTGGRRPNRYLRGASAARVSETSRPRSFAARRIIRRRSQRSRSSGQRVAHLDWKRELRR